MYAGLSLVILSYDVIICGGTLIIFSSLLKYYSFQGEEKTERAASIILGLEKTNKNWNIISEPNLSRQFHLDEDIKNRFQQIAVIAITSNDIEDYKIIDIGNLETTNNEKSTNFNEKSTNLQTDITTQKSIKTNLINIFYIFELTIDLIQFELKY